MQQERLPYMILEQAAQLFAGHTGFSYSEMQGYFAYHLNKHPDEIEIPHGKNKAETFKNWLQMFPPGKQR